MNKEQKLQYIPLVILVQGGRLWTGRPTNCGSINDKGWRQGWKEFLYSKICRIDLSSVVHSNYLLYAYQVLFISQETWSALEADHSYPHMPGCGMNQGLSKSTIFYLRLHVALRTQNSFYAIDTTNHIILYYIILYYIILYYIILRDHRRICGAPLTETSLCSAYLYQQQLDMNENTRKQCLKLVRSVIHTSIPILPHMMAVSLNKLKLEKGKGSEVPYTEV